MKAGVSGREDRPVEWARKTYISCTQSVGEVNRRRGQLVGSVPFHTRLDRTFGKFSSAPPLTLPRPSTGAGQVLNVGKFSSAPPLTLPRPSTGAGSRSPRD